MCLMFDSFRQKLRRLEVAMMEYQESLEERCIISPDDVERKVAVYRKRLESEYGLSESGEDLSRSSKFDLSRSSKFFLLVLLTHQ